MSIIMRSVLLFSLGVAACLGILWLPATLDMSRTDAVSQVDIKSVDVDIQQVDRSDVSNANADNHVDIKPVNIGSLQADRLDDSNADAVNNVEIKPISVGVQQTDILPVRRLAAISFEQPLLVVTIPQQVTRSVKQVSAHRMPVTPIASSGSFGRPDQATPDRALQDDNVPADLLARFNRAMAETSDTQNIPVAATPETHNAVPIAELPERLRTQVPNINYSSHVYSSKPQNRSVRLNNRDLREGSWLSENVEVLEIMQNEVIMRVGPQSFSLKALADWSR